MSRLLEERPVNLLLSVPILEDVLLRLDAISRLLHACDKVRKEQSDWQLSSSSRIRVVGLSLKVPGTSRVILDVGNGTFRCVVAGGGSTSEFFFPPHSLFAMLDFFGVEADRLCGVKDLLGFLICLLGLLVLLLLIGINSLVSSLSALPFPIDFSNHFDFLSGLADLDVRTDLDLRASESSLGLSLEDFSTALAALGAEGTQVILDLASGSLRCFVAGGGVALEFFFPPYSLFAMLSFLEIEADRLCGVKDLLGLLICLLGYLILLLVIGLDPLVSSLSALLFPIDFPNHFDFLLGLADLDVRTDLDLRASESSLVPSAFVRLNASLA